MDHEHITRMETQVRELHEHLETLASHQPVHQLLDMIHKPGWTSIAEQAMISGLLDAMFAQARALSALKLVLLDGASKVELNPQPLPPKE
jgi:hypothetical protein